MVHFTTRKRKRTQSTQCHPNPPEQHPRSYGKRRRLRHKSCRPEPPEQRPHSYGKHKRLRHKSCRPELAEGPEIAATVQGRGNSTIANVNLSAMESGRPEPARDASVRRGSEGAFGISHVALSLPKGLNSLTFEPFQGQVNPPGVRCGYQGVFLSPVPSFELLLACDSGINV